MQWKANLCTHEKIVTFAKKSAYDDIGFVVNYNAIQ